MKVSGFTVIKDAVKFDFPIKESILSLLPLCDEFIVGVGKSNDGTLALIKSIKSAKLRIVESEWETFRTGKEHTFVTKTNEVLNLCRGDWCFYIQGDEAVNEEDYEMIINAMHDNLYDQRVEGLLFRYKHFFGTPHILVNSYHWYPNEIRIIRNDMGIKSWKDAQGFRRNGNKLHVKRTGAYIYHYGWTRHPEVMREKSRKQWAYHHNQDEIDEYFKNFSLVDVYCTDPYTLKYYDGAHPATMREWVKLHSRDFKIENIKFRHNSDSARKRIQLFIARLTGIRTGEYKNYILMK